MELATGVTRGRKRIFVVDDDLGVRESMIKVLKGVGYDVVTASDGEEASRRFVPDKCDLVLLDLNLPLRSGWDVFEHLTTQHPTIPVIIITAMPNQFRTALAAGVGALLEKPIEVPVLLDTIKALLTEPPEARLRRMCGYQHDVKHFRPSNADGAAVLRLSLRGQRPKHRLQPG